MEDTRNRFKARCVLENIPLDMVLNYDQLWKSNYRHPRKVLHKASRRVGTRIVKKHTLKQNKAFKALGSQPDASRQGGRGKEAVDDEVVRHDKVSGEKNAMTVVTSTWADGTAGPMCFCVAVGFMP